MGVHGERGGIRTLDPRIKSALLYHLSYALSPCFNVSQGARSRSLHSLTVDLELPVRLNVH